MKVKSIFKKLALILFVLIVSLTAIEICTINRPVTEVGNSMYYRDSLSIKDLLSRYPDFDTINGVSSSMIMHDDYLFYAGNISDTTFVYDMNQYVSIANKKTGESLKLDLRIKCWKDNVYYLDEIEPSYYGLIRRLFFYFKGAMQRHVITCNNYESLLLTQNDTTYFTKAGYLWVMTPQNEYKICKFPIEDPIHNQMLKYGNLAFIRTGFSIYLSEDNLKTWRQIYNGYRSIKESMYFDTDNERLLFSQYTPGKERIRHYIRSYSLDKNQIDTLVTFYTQAENKEKGLVPFCRHMHILTQDPYSGDLFLGNGDGDSEAGIYLSKDKGNSFIRVGGGDQTWRTLSFIFTEKYIYWNNDCATPQFLCRISRDELDSLPISNERITRYPLVNGACWGVNKYGEMYIMSSNSEGSLYDNNHRVYGILIDNDGTPIVYNLLAEKSTNLSSNQLFIQGVDCRGIIWFHDESGTRKFKLIKNS